MLDAKCSMHIPYNNNYYFPLTLTSGPYACSMDPGTTGIEQNRLEMKIQTLSNAVPLGTVSPVWEPKAPGKYSAHQVSPHNHREGGLTYRGDASAQMQVGIWPQLEFAPVPQSPAHSVYQGKHKPEECKRDVNTRFAQLSGQIPCWHGDSHCVSGPQEVSGQAVAA